jgi:hypothetical protein
MLNKLSALFLSLVVLAVPSLAFAQTAGAPPSDDLGGMVSLIVDAAKGGQWGVFASLAIMILVFLATKVPFVQDWLPSAARPWVAAGAGVLGAVAATVLTTGDWVQAILSGFLTGAAASGLWSLVGRHVLKTPAE